MLALVCTGFCRIPFKIHDFDASRGSTFRITGSKKQSEGRAALFAVRVRAIVRVYIRSGLKNRILFQAHCAFSANSKLRAFCQRPGRLKLLRARSTLALITQSST